MNNLGPSDLLSQVTPQTRGLLWLTNEAITSQLPFYKGVDYLLNGLLTSTLKIKEFQNCYVLVGENFGKVFYVIVCQDWSENEFRSFFNLVKPQMEEGSHLLLIDENNSFPKVQKLAPPEIRAKIQVIQ